MKERKREKERGGGGREKWSFNILELNIMSYLPYTQGRG